MASILRKSLRRNRGEEIPSKPRGTPFTINLLDGETRIIHVDRKDKAQLLIDKLLSELDLTEDEYFGLCWRDKNSMKNWLDPEKALRKQLSSEETTLDFRVRFYAEDPCQLSDEFCRYLFCLQIKQDLLAGRLPCSFYTGALLASYAVQAEAGDYDAEQVDSDGIPTCIKEMEFVPGQNEEFECQVAEFHKSHVGQTPGDAEMNMLDKVKRLELYGVDLHPALDLEGIRLYIGVSPTGIRIYQAGDMVRMNSFNWAKVLQVSFHKDKFYIQLRPSEKSVVKDTIGFRITSIPACKNLWKSCVDHHTFFRLYVAEKRVAPIVGLFRTGSKYRASVRGTQKQALERSKSCHALADSKLPNFERVPSQRMGKSKSEGEINLLGTKPYVRNSFYDTYRSVPSDERLNRPGDSFMVTTTVSPVQRPASAEDHVYNNMAIPPPAASPPQQPQFVPSLEEDDHLYAKNAPTLPPRTPPPLAAAPNGAPPSDEEEEEEEEGEEEEEEEEELEEEEEEDKEEEVERKEEVNEEEVSGGDEVSSGPEIQSDLSRDPSPVPVLVPPPVFHVPPPTTVLTPASDPEPSSEEDETASSCSDDSEIVEIIPVARENRPAPPPPSYNNENEIPIYSPIIKSSEPPKVAPKPEVAVPVGSVQQVDRPPVHRAPSPPPEPVVAEEPKPVVEYDSIDEIRSAPPLNATADYNRQPPEPKEDPVKVLPPPRQEEETLPWHDKSQFNLDDEWLDLEKLTNDVARMTDEIALGLDLDGPEKNVYVVNPRSNIVAAPPPRDPAPPTYGAPPSPVRSSRAPRTYHSPKKEPTSPSIINDTPSAADIMRKWQQRDRQTKAEMRSF